MPAVTASAVPAGPEESLVDRYVRIRAATTALVEPLSAEDAQAQSMPAASPAKWHLAHTTWFFERFVLGSDSAYVAPHPQWHHLFNSYYRTAGTFHARAARGLLTRPSLDEVLDWRRHVDAAMRAKLVHGQGDAELEKRVTLGLNHEQQHQELLLTDIKHLLWCNPLQPAYHTITPPSAGADVPLRFLPGRDGVVEIGAPSAGFAYDNERPRHAQLLTPHALANRLVTNAEYRAFIEDGGYRIPTLWMSDGWDRIEQEGWTRPLYWMAELDHEFTLAGLRAIDPLAPVCHLSWYEADAFAHWAGARLPREAEWEAMVQSRTPDADSNLRDRGLLHPVAPGAGAMSWFGDVWEWTASPYVGYPGFRPLGGSFGEYNGKFMSGQMVLRGGSCATPADHIRASYRNFFAPHLRWQFSGLRLARDA